MSETDEQKASLRENVLFYTTAFFCLMATFSLFIFLFLVPFFIEPALTTIYMEFNPTPITCQTINATHLKGLSNCQWSSCREGCTKEVYECSQIYVRYLSPVPVGEADSRGVRNHQSSLRPVNLKNIHLNSGNGPPSSSSSSSSNTLAVFSEKKEPTTTSLINENRIQSVLPNDDEEMIKGVAEVNSNTHTLEEKVGDGLLHAHVARLQPNVKGCGYPPDVECNATFLPTYGVVGANFSCYYSLIDPTLVITQLNIDKIWAELIYCLTIPIIIFVISVVYLFYAYFKLYAELPANTMQGGKSSQNCQLDKQGQEEENEEGAVTIQPIQSPSRMGGKYGPLYQCPSPDNSMKAASSKIVRRSKSGGATTFSSSTKKSAQDLVINSNSCEARSNNLTANRGMRVSKSMG